jgi:tetratricopeptide (TPR) repeat protein
MATEAARLPGTAIGSAPAASPFWIINGFKDFLLFAGTPFLIIPTIIFIEKFIAASSMYLVVAAFGALGHHLPGMMRAYGDRDLFARFKTRFIMGPIVLIGTCLAFAVVDPSMYAITVIAYGWGLWHGLMQIFGFLRIYDAKVKSFSRMTTRLDMWMCITWFASGILFSASRMHFLLEAFYYAGGPLVPEPWISNAQVMWGTVTALITLAFLANAVYRWRIGNPAHPIKYFTMATSLSFWIYVCMGVNNLLVGILMFEIFHDVQYLTIVWLFNRKRSQTQPERIGRFTNWLFGQAQSRAILYVGLVMAYGCLYFIEMGFFAWNPVSLTDNTPVWGGLLAASGLLHFYYDGFIWKVKEKPTRQLLGLDGGREVQGNGTWWNTQWKGMPGWFEHGFNWTPFVLIVSLFFYAAYHPAMTENDSRIALASTFPNYDLAQSNLGIVLYTQGDLEGAVIANRRALAMDPGDRILRDTLNNNLSSSLIELAERDVERGNLARAESRLSEVAAIEPTHADVLNNQGAELTQRGQHRAAAIKYQCAVLIQPEHPYFRMNLAIALAQQGQLPAALREARIASRLSPSSTDIAKLVQQLEARLGTGSAP